MDKQCLVNIMSFIAFPWARSTLGFQNMSETKLTDIRLTSGIELEFVLLLRMKAPLRSTHRFLTTHWRVRLIFWVSFSDWDSPSSVQVHVESGISISLATVRALQRLFGSKT